MQDQLYPEHLEPLHKKKHGGGIFLWMAWGNLNDVNLSCQCELQLVR